MIYNYIYKYYIKERFLRKSFHRNLLMFHFFLLSRRSLHNIHPLWASLSNSFQPSPRMTDHRKLTLSFSLSIFVSTFFSVLHHAPGNYFHLDNNTKRNLEIYNYLRYHVVVKKIARIILGKEGHRQSTFAPSHTVLIISYISVVRYSAQTNYCQRYRTFAWAVRCDMHAGNDLRCSNTMFVIVYQ